MSDAISKLRARYWTPAQDQEEPSSPPVRPDLATACEHCRSEFLIGARYCHVCGAKRRPLAKGGLEGSLWADLSRLPELLGLATAPLLAAAAGLICVLAAVVSMFADDGNPPGETVHADSVLWMLGAIAALLLGILLKKTR
jgi:hypothetical protein